MDADKYLKIDECPLEIMAIEVLNVNENKEKESKEKLVELKKSLLKILARASTRQSLGAKVIFIFMRHYFY